MEIGYSLANVCIVEENIALNLANNLRKTAEYKIFLRILN